jgi:hypothetical protein
LWHETAKSEVYIRKDHAPDLDENLSQLKVKDFLEQMKPVAKENYRVLKNDR